MKYAVLFEDDPSAGPGIRAAHMARHLAFLEAHAERVRAAGPLAKPDGQAAGGLWIVEAEDAEAVRGLVEADPFWPTGLRRSVQILAWTQVFADGRRQVGPR
ncbi:MAG: hypothetical protein H6843_12290 [Rhodospirillaceae bacterium]|nr:hypothetical protein [Rhodospirillaceae bacterium]